MQSEPTVAPQTAAASAPKQPALPVRLTRGLHIVALLEATKGLLVFAAGIGALSLVDRDAGLILEKIVRHLLLNPDGHLVHYLVERVDRITDRQLLFIAGGSMLYSGMRFAESYGLWKNRAWAEWFAVLSGLVYVPFEILAIHHHATALKFGLLGLNLLIVGYVARVLWIKRRNRRAATTG